MKKTHENLHTTLKCSKSIKDTASLKTHSDSGAGTKITLQSKCLIRASLKLTRSFTVKL